MKRGTSQCREIEEELCPGGFPEVEQWKARYPLGFQPPEWVDGQLVFRYNAAASRCARSHSTIRTSSGM